MGRKCTGTDCAAQTSSLSASAHGPSASTSTSHLAVSVGVILLAPSPWQRGAAGRERAVQQNGTGARGPSHHSPAARRTRFCRRRPVRRGARFRATTGASSSAAPPGEL